MSKFKLIETGKKVGARKRKEDVKTSIYYLPKEGIRIPVKLYYSPLGERKQCNAINWEFINIWKESVIKDFLDVRASKEAVKLMNELSEMKGVLIPNFKAENTNPIWHYKNRSFKIYRCDNHIKVMFKNRLGEVVEAKFKDLVSDIEEEKLYGNNPLIEHYEEEL